MGFALAAGLFVAASLRAQEPAAQQRAVEDDLDRILMTVVRELEKK